MRIEQVMSPGVWTCRAEDSANAVAQAMWEHDLGCLPVVDDDGRAIATVTDRDLCMAAYTQGRPLSDIPVRTAMSKRIVAARPTDTLEMATRLMQEHQLHRLVVVDDDMHPVGTMTLHDLARSTTKRGGASGDEIALTLQAIGRPPTFESPAVAAE